MNKPIGVQMYTIMGISDQYVAVSHRKQFYIINHSRLFALMATVAIGAVRLSISLRLVCFIHVFQNGEHEHEFIQPQQQQCRSAAQ